MAAALADIALGSPANGIVEIAGPEQFRLDELIRQYLSAIRDPRQVTMEYQVHYFGAELGARSLAPGGNAQITSTRFANWLEGRADLLGGYT